MKKIRTKNLYIGELLRFEYHYEFEADSWINRKLSEISTYSPRKYVLVKKGIFGYKNIFTKRRYKYLGDAIKIHLYRFMDYNGEEVIGNLESFESREKSITYSDANTIYQELNQVKTRI